MRTVLIFTIIVVSLLLLFFGFVYQFLFNGYVDAFKPSNAPIADEKINETITTTNMSKQQQQQQSTETKESLLDIKKIPTQYETISYSFIKAWGSQGSEDGQFFLPLGISIDSQDNVYVADAMNKRIQKFDSNGNFITKWGEVKLGEGWSDVQFVYPKGIASDSSGNVYVADTERIQKFDSNGNFITKWGSYGTEHGEFIIANCITVDSQDNVYVVDEDQSALSSFDRIQKFDSNGNFITKWGSEGIGEGEFSDFSCITVDSQDNVYVTDDGNGRIIKFDSNGNFITKWGSGGSEDGQFSNPYGIAVDSSGNVYVADEDNNRIQKFDSNGNFITKWGSGGSEDGQFSYLNGIAIDSKDNVYVADSGNHRIQVFAPST
jgi:DNA-binding beta-propeller fold protein YncE